VLTIGAACRPVAVAAPSQRIRARTRAGMKTSVPGNARAHSEGNRVSTHIFVRHREGFVADALQSYLQDEGYHVTVTGGFDAVVKQSQPADTCLVDMGVSGASAGIRRVVTMEQPPRVVALVDNERHIALALDSGANACVTAADGLERLSHILRSEIVMTSRETAAVAQRALDRVPKPRSAYHLTAREIDVLAGLVRGESTKALAARMSVRPATARTHVQHVLAKLGVHSRLQAVAFVIEHPISSMSEATCAEGEEAAVS
jgi:two-component system, NarL family, nitrate/nitrite response regulator NarL